MSKYKPAPRPKLIGPPENAANHRVIAALQARCIQCPYCMELWHVDMERKAEAAIQMKLGGRCIAVRRAMFMAWFSDIEIQPGNRVTSRCKNANCINPRLLMQAAPGYILGKQYVNGVRDRKTATRHLVIKKLAESKLSDFDVIRIREDKRKGTEAAHEFGITPEHYNAIQRLDTRAKIMAGAR